METAQAAARAQAWELDAEHAPDHGCDVTKPLETRSTVESSTQRPCARRLPIGSLPARLHDRGQPSPPLGQRRPRWWTRRGEGKFDRTRLLGKAATANRCQQLNTPIAIIAGILDHRLELAVPNIALVERFGPASAMGETIRMHRDRDDDAPCRPWRVAGSCAPPGTGVLCSRPYRADGPTL
jgi:hypothetical protein